MKKKFVTLLTLMCLIFSCSPAIIANAGDSHENHKVTVHGEYGGHWTETCTKHSNCTIAVTMKCYNKVVTEVANKIY